MGRRLHRLSAKTVAGLRRSGMWADGGGLYLNVSPARTKSWIFRFERMGCEQQMGLGSVNDVDLAKARKKAQECRQLLADGINPLAAKKAKKAQDALTEARSITFRQCAEAYIKAHRVGWKNGKHADQWTNTIEAYCGPVFGDLPVQAVDTALVLRVLEPIWTEKHETASRLRQRIERVLSWAAVHRYRSGDNPARWKDHLEHSLARISKEETVEHFAALPFKDIPAFMEALRAQKSTAARALEFTILTAMRTGAVIGARREEFDLGESLWTVPAARMKGKKAREHPVPLPERAAAIAKAQLKAAGDYVFPGLKPKTPLSNMAMAAVLERMGYDHITVHGFRSTFKDWAAETTAFPNIVSEAALGHRIPNKVEAAYRRGALLQKRKALMGQWARYCELPAKAGKVVKIGKAA